MKPTLIITKYMSRNFLLTLVEVMIALFLLVYLFDFIELLRRTSEKDTISVYDVMEMTAFKLPSMFHMLLPFGFLISSLLVFWRMTRSNELVIIRASGISVWQFIAPLAVIALIIGVINITIINPLASASFKNFERMEEKFGMSSSRSLGFDRQSIWLKEKKDDMQYIIHAEKIKQQEGFLNLQDLSILESSPDDIFQRRIEAGLGKLDDGKFLLTNAWVMEAGKAPVHKGNIEISTNLSLTKIEDTFSSPETISFWTIPSFINFFEQTGFSPLKHKLYWYSLMASPLFLLAMVLIGAAFSLKTNQRQGKVFLNTTIALCTGFSLYFFSKLTYALGASASIPLFLAVIAPSLIAIPVAIFLLLHYEDGA